ncbi:MAG: hypothetical protein ABI338_02345 [Gemmatimonadaceae bacterium]
MLTAACSGNDISCAQEITVAGPVVQITSVTNSQTGSAIPQFTLSNFAMNGQQQDAALLIAGVPNTNAQAVNGTLMCSGTCGFGQSAGSYTFTVSATGVQDKVVTVAAKYSSTVGQGCSRSAAGGTQIAITL